MENIKVGIIGYSNIAQKSIIPAILSHPKYELIYIASRSIEKQQEISAKYGVLSGNYESLLHNDEIEAVYVSLPVGLHYEYGKKVLEANKHLLLEKTFTHSLKNSESLLKLAYEKKLVAFEGLMYIYHPLLREVQRLVSNGEIGEIKHIEAYFGFPHLNKDDIRYNRSLGGGAILDALIYPLSFVLLMLGNNYKIASSIVLFNQEHQIDENGTLLLDFPNSTAIIKYGFGLAYRNEYKVWGTKGILTSERVFSRPPNHTSPITIEENTNKREIEVLPSNHFYDMLDAFYLKCMHEKKEIDTNILTRMKLIDQIYKDGYNI